MPKPALILVLLDDSGPGGRRGVRRLDLRYLTESLSRYAFMRLESRHTAWLCILYHAHTCKTDQTRRRESHSKARLFRSDGSYKVCGSLAFPPATATFGRRRGISVSSLLSTLLGLFYQRPSSLTEL